ncbi:MAG: hypothetical protein HC898_07860 [Phycisphaerales bacterium]|nr:hypothetical protein [Phycisphaerales bacterium]
MTGQAANTGTFRISTGDAPTTRAINVNFTLAGTATRGNLPTGDYIIKVGEQLITTGIVTIPAGQIYVDVTVVPHNDNKVEADETVQLNLAYSTAYTLPTALNLKQAVVTILDNEPTITVEAIDALAGETLRVTPMTLAPSAFVARG